MIKKGCPEENKSFLPWWCDGVLLTWIFSLWHRGGNISVKTICSFHTGSAVDFWVQVRPWEATKEKKSQIHFQTQFTDCGG